MLAPGLLLVAVGLVIPSLILLFKSFLESQGYGQITYQFTLSNYSDFLGDPVNRAVTLTALQTGAIAALICTAASYPVAYFITYRLKRGRNLVLFLVVASLLSSYLVRIYAWWTILGERGLINGALLQIGIIKQPLLFLLFSRWAELIAFVNIFLPYTILIITSSMQNVPRDLLASARDLGAGPLRTFSRVLLPLTMAGAVAAFIYTFILTASDYITPQLVGGTDGTFVGTVISDQFLQLGNQPAGAAMSFTLLAIFLVVFLGLSQLERWKGF
jgi:spermidine/putrescine transport system permease protein